VAFLAGAEDASELSEFIHLMFRPFLRDTTKPVQESVGNLDASMATRRQQQGFLNLLRIVIKQLGYQVLSFVPSFMDLLLGLLECAVRPSHDLAPDDEDDAQKEDEEEEEEEERDDAMEGVDETDGKRRRSSSAGLRSLTVTAMADLMEQFSTDYDFLSHAKKLWASLGKLTSISLISLQFGF